MTKQDEQALLKYNDPIELESRLRLAECIIDELCGEVDAIVYL